MIGMIGRGGPPRAAVLTSVLALLAGAATWHFLGVAADRGIERLARIDRLRAVCAERYAAAVDRSDTLRVDRSALPDTVDPSSKDRIAQCGALRGPSQPDAPPNPREMSGEPMPRGLR